MSTYPTSPRSAFLEWCQAHETVFVGNASKIGLTVAQADAFRMATDTAAAAALAQEQAKQAAKVATQAAADAFSTLRSRAGDTVKLIKAFADNSANPSEVYQIAQIPPPAPPSPAPPPGQPRDLTVALEATRGAIKLAWKCDNPAGTSGTAYIVRRKLPGEAEFAFIGVTGTKKFADDTLIAGPDSVQYTVQAQRADSSGPVSAIYTINFGRLPGGGLTAQVAGAVREGLHAATTAGGPGGSPHPSIVDAIINSKPLANGQPTRNNARV